MPITGPSSYPPTVQEFLEHWAQVDATLPNPLVLTGNMPRQHLEDRLSELEDLRNAINDLNIDRAVARADLNNKIVVLRTRFMEFADRVRADWPQSGFAPALPQTFKPSEAESTVRDALRQTARVWTSLNAATPPAGITVPMELQAGFVVGDFNDLLSELRDAYRHLSDMEVDLRIARENRNDKQDEIYEILKTYRLKVPSMLPAGHALIESLPTLSPAPGRTPAPVHAQAVWDAANTRAAITWNASTDADLEQYEVRGVPGDSYNTDDEVVLGNIAPDAAREFATDFALTQPGLTAGFKVYVVLTTGNERGSESVYVTRPA